MAPQQNQPVGGGGGRGYFSRLGMCIHGQGLKFQMSKAGKMNTFKL